MCNSIGAIATSVAHHTMAHGAIAAVQRTRPWRRHGKSRRRRHQTRHTPRRARRPTRISVARWRGSPIGSAARPRNGCCGRTCCPPRDSRARRRATRSLPRVEPEIPEDDGIETTYGSRARYWPLRTHLPSTNRRFRSARGFALRPSRGSAAGASGPSWRSIWTLPWRRAPTHAGTSLVKDGLLEPRLLLGHAHQCMCEA